VRIAETRPFNSLLIGSRSFDEALRRIEGELVPLSVPIGELPLLYVNGYVLDGAAGHHEVDGK
jgi:hypothetical protein